MPHPPPLLRLLTRAILPLVLLPAACQVAFGNFEVKELPLGSCGPRDYRCFGPLLTRCNDTLSGWDLVKECASVSRCDSGARACSDCATEEYRCTPTGALHGCRPDGTWDEEPLANCSEAALCDPLLMACAPCTAGEFRCNDGSLMRCAAGRWELDTTCASPDLCQVGDDRTMGSCLEACVPGIYECSQAELRLCSSRGTWILIDTCLNQALCQSSIAGLPVPKPGQPMPSCKPACDTGGLRCTDSVLERCAVDRASYEKVLDCPPDGDPCNPKQGNCSLCTPGELHCLGAELWTCDSRGRWELSETCKAASLCDASQGCVATQCEPGAVRCEGLALEQCSAQLQWEGKQVCDTQALCDKTRRDALLPGDNPCALPLCQIDARRCLGPRHQECLEDRTGWRTLESCLLGAQCDPAVGCVPGPCSPPDSYRCNDVLLERCTDRGWEPVERCATPGLCAATQQKCTPPQCKRGDADVCGAFEVLKQCTDNREWKESFVDRTTCPAAGPPLR